jgi:hypothetical protein
LNFDFQGNNKMSKKNDQMGLRPRFFASMMILAAMLTLPGCKKQPAQQAPVENNHNKPPPSAPAAESPNKSATLPQANPKADILVGPRVSPKPKLRDVIMAARTWGPAYSYSFGQKTF